MIRFEHLSKTFQTKDGAFEALKDVSFEIEKGDIYGVIGYSGAGKSTLIRMVNALERPTSGKIFVEDKDIGSLSAKELRSLRKGIGMIFQQFNLLAQRNVLQNVCFPMEIAGVPKAEAKKRAAELLKLVGLEERMKAYPAQLSGGMQQRAAIARALAYEPTFIMMDEPFAALDYFTREQMQKELLRVQQERSASILFVTHSIDEALILGSQIAVIEKGMVKALYEVKAPQEERNLLEDEMITLKRDIINNLHFI